YNGELYVATDTGLMILDGNGPVSSVPLTSAKTASGEDLGADDLLELLNGCRIRSIVSDSQGRLWISTWQAHGLLRYDRGEITAFTAADGLLSEHVRIACETPDGAMLIACTGGVNVIEGDRVTAAYGTGDGIANPESLSVVSAPNGDIVLGSNGGGIYVINKDGVRCVGKNDGLSSGIIMRIKYDEARDLYWLVTSNSLAYMTSDYRVTTVSNFPFSNNFDMYENSRGDMWILSGDGIYVLPADELIENGRMSPLHYGMANGLPCIATSNSYSALTDDGDLYIAGSSGVAKVNIEEDPEKVGDIRQSVPYVDADDVRIYPDETGGFTIPSNVRKLTIHGHVYSYSLTDPQVSYYLDGFDREAATVSRSELGPVSYTNLPGGSYRFVMELKDALGQESKTLSVPIVKEKAFYELAWVHILAGLAAALIIALLVRSYVRRKMRALEEKHREEKERERIENELTMANKIQSSMLPHLFPPFPDRKEFDLYASMDPAKEVGGDFYDFFLVDDDHLCLVMADVSGKGVPAALFMMVSKVILQSYGNMGQSAAEILTKTNEAICSNNQAEMFVTVWLGILEISTGKLTAANAGHEYPVLRKPGGGFELVKDKHGLVIGGMEGVRYREYELQMEPGSKLFLYTDGVPEATDADNNMFGADRMVAALNTDPEAAPEQILKNVRAAVDAFVKDAEQFDDLTMLCLEYHG
ncbi:MAG: SpoIIE family protein phosphatase, partial [Oscillospiraceae bacterium]|nr:SpoIIE family protein phosphatase [Oscillospiraceae bacterium]